MTIPEIREGNVGAVRRRANEALEERDITCLGAILRGMAGSGFSSRARTLIPYRRIILGSRHTLIGERYTESSGIQ